MTVGIASLMITSVYAKNIALNINNQIILTPVAPIQEAGTTLVPLRTIGENLGAQLDWNKEIQTVTITKGATEIKLVINSKTVIVNNEKQQILAAPKLKNGTTMVPIRFISENLNSDVRWDAPNQTVFITSKTNTNEYGEERYFSTADDGDTMYEGQVVLRDGLEIFDGQGKYVLSDGETYEGTFKNNMCNGQGKMVYANGDIYIGAFKDCMRNGKGKYIYVSGDVYEGEFKEDLFHGQGKYVFADGEIYVGDYKDDLRHGYGKLTSSDGEVQEGRFEEDEFVEE